jgi:hypothetical protein
MSSIVSEPVFKMGGAGDPPIGTAESNLGNPIQVPMAGRSNPMSERPQVIDANRLTQNNPRLIHLRVFFAMARGLRTS